jgi:hypothetical protein
MSNSGVNYGCGEIGANCIIDSVAGTAARFGARPKSAMGTRSLYGLIPSLTLCHLLLPIHYKGEQKYGLPCAVFWVLLLTCDWACSWVLSLSQCRTRPLRRQWDWIQSISGCPWLAILLRYDRYTSYTSKTELYKDHVYVLLMRVRHRLFQTTFGNVKSETIDRWTESYIPPRKSVA